MRRIDSKAKNIFSFIILIGIALLEVRLIYAQEEKPFSYYEIIEKRNFFRPKEEEEKEEKTQEIKEETKKEEKETQRFILTGIVNIKGKLKAIIEKTQGGGFYVEEGESVEDFLVDEITPQSVVLKKENTSVVLKLRKSKPASTKKANLSQQEKGKESQETSQKDLNYKPDLIQKIRTGKVKE